MNAEEKEAYYRSEYFNAPLSAEHVDHIIPRDRGGLNDLGNLQTLCGSGWNCNVSKSNKIPSNAGEIIAPPPKLTGLITATELDEHYRLTHY